jgi:hypothetical protein
MACVWHQLILIINKMDVEEEEMRGYGKKSDCSNFIK